MTTFYSRFPSGGSGIQSINGDGTSAQLIVGGTGISVATAAGTTTITNSGGTVTSINVSGGTTGLITSGGPITGSGTITLAGTANVTHGGTGTTTQFTSGSVVFAGASGVYSQDNAKLFWDDTNYFLGIGTASPTNSLHVGGSGARFTGAYDDNSTNVGVYCGEIGGVSRIMLAGGTAIENWNIDNSSSDLRFFTPGVIQMSLQSSRLYLPQKNIFCGLGSGDNTFVSNIITNGLLTVDKTASSTNTVQTVAALKSESSGTVANGFGAAINFSLQSSTTAAQDSGQISSIWTTATHATRTSALVFSVVNSASALTEAVRITGAGSTVFSTSALATTATDGFIYIPTCAGVPTGVPTSYAGTVATVYDTTDNKLYIYNGAWKSVTLT